MWVVNGYAHSQSMKNFYLGPINTISVQYRYFSRPVLVCKEISFKPPTGEEQRPNWRHDFKRISVSIMQNFSQTGKMKGSTTY